MENKVRQHFGLQGAEPVPETVEKTESKSKTKGSAAKTSSDKSASEEDAKITAQTE